MHFDLLDADYSDTHIVWFGLLITVYVYLLDVDLGTESVKVAPT